jgi:hypothetical protein
MPGRLNIGNRETELTRNHETRKAGKRVSRRTGNPEIRTGLRNPKVSKDLPRRRGRGTRRRVRTPTDLGGYTSRLSPRWKGAVIDPTTKRFPWRMIAVDAWNPFQTLSLCSSEAPAAASFSARIAAFSASISSCRLRRCVQSNPARASSISCRFRMEVRG